MGMGLPGMGGVGGGMLGGLVGGAGNGGTLMGDSGINLSGIPFIGGMFPNPNEGAVRDAMNAANQSYSNMRPQMAQGYQNIASQFQNQMAPASQALSNMYGGQHGQNSDVTANIAAQQAQQPMQQSPQQQPGQGGSGGMMGLLGGGGSGGGSFGLGDLANAAGNAASGGTLNLLEGKNWDPFAYQEGLKFLKGL